ncbi:MAG TPA: hypothetical protein VFM49_24140 [Chloroflexia bacterium]|jgi:hypothetical protein|nr:hypothetical protein [Chloroflexia bacterium]
MTSAVTTTTVTTVNTLALAGALSLVTVATLVGLLIYKQLLMTSPAAGTTNLAKVLNVAIAPLILAFGLIMVAKLVTLF